MKVSFLVECPACGDKRMTVTCKKPGLSLASTSRVNTRCLSCDSTTIFHVTRVKGGTPNQVAVKPLKINLSKRLIAQFEAMEANVEATDASVAAELAAKDTPANSTLEAV
jgi:hypothetical protein